MRHPININILWELGYWIGYQTIVTVELLGTAYLIAKASIELLKGFSG
jgi:hypothetical protein